MAQTRRPKAGSVIFLLALLAITIAITSASGCRGERKDEVGSWRAEPDGSISFVHYLGPVGRFRLNPDPVPQELLARVRQGILFALENGAAKEISLYDLYHCHLLYRADKDRAERNINTVDGILFHAQEWIFYTEEMIKKRNIFVGPDGPKIVPCQITRGSNSIRYCGGGSPKGFSMVGPTPGLYFIVVDTIHKKLLQKYKHNIIIVNRHKVLVGHPDFQ